MDCSCSFSVSVSKLGDPHARNFSYVLILSLLGSIVCFGGLGAVQNECSVNGDDAMLVEGLEGFSGAVLGCKKLYRYYWFIVSFGFVAAAYGLWLTLVGKLNASRAGITGLLVVSTVLTINMTNAVYGLLDVPKFQGDTAKDRVKAWFAGCIIVATVQSFALFMAGLEQDTAAASTSAKKPAEKPVAEAPKAIEMPAGAPAPDAPPAAEGAVAVSIGGAQA